MKPATGILESISLKALNVVVLSSSETGRRLLVDALLGTEARVARAVALPSLDELPGVLADCEALLIDMNGDLERGLDLVEAACALNAGLPVMVYSNSSAPELVVRCMRAGAREFLTGTLSSSSLSEALVRASARREELRRQKKLMGKALVFIGAKGGSGVTTAAGNFAVALAQESGQPVVLADLNPQLGDAALNLGLTGTFSAVDALQAEARLDSDFVNTLLQRHSSGLHVLGSPDTPHSFQATASGVAKIIDILRGDFAWVVVDAGSHQGAYAESLFEMADKVYLLTQVNVAELRNAHRLIEAHFKGESGRKLEVVLNRYSGRTSEIDPESVQRALGVPLPWRLPSDYAAVQAAQNQTKPLVSNDDEIGNILKSMARKACGKPELETKKKRFAIFR